MADFIPGVTPIPASGAVITDADKAAMHAQIDKGWLTAGPVNRQFEQALSEFTGIKHVRTCNSGSSANLLAVAAMVEAGIWKAGDEIITTACGFPTTVNPLLLYGLVPLFVDVEIGTYNVNPDEIYRVAQNYRVKGAMLAHTLGNPFHTSIREILSSRAIPVIEDCCDALGSTYSHDYDRVNRHVGQEAAIATCSFFPAHHITTGEGGAVFTNDGNLARMIESVRDWGRDCYCEPGQNNTCGRRFECEIDGVAYDHKYSLTQLGYNLKGNEIGSACGLSQLSRLNKFVDERRTNFDRLRNLLSGIDGHIVLPEATPRTSPSWFGFPITIRESGQRQALQEYLSSQKIDSRLIFGGNLTRQPYMKGRNFRIGGSLENSDKIMADSLWVGIHPALTEEMLEFIADKVKAFFA